MCASVSRDCGLGFSGRDTCGCGRVRSPPPLSPQSCVFSAGPPSGWACWSTWWRLKPSLLQKEGVDFCLGRLALASWSVRFSEGFRLPLGLLVGQDCSPRTVCSAGASSLRPPPGPLPLHALALRTVPVSSGSSWLGTPRIRRGSEFCRAPGLPCVAVHVSGLLVLSSRAAGRPVEVFSVLVHGRPFTRVEVL